MTRSDIYNMNAARVSVNKTSGYQGKVVLVTGGAGCIGSNLVQALLDTGASQVVIIDDLSAGQRWNVPRVPKVVFIEGSILNEEMLKRAFSSRPEFVFHLAAHFANQNSVENPETDLMVNGVGTLRVLQYAQLTDVKRVVYASSGCGVYGLESKMPFEEHDVSISLHTPYQVTKLLGELYTNYFHNLFDLPIVNARFFNVYGPGEVPGRFRNVIPNFFYLAMNGRPLTVTGDGNDTRDWTYVGDIVSGLLAMGTRDEAVGQAINLGSGVEHRVGELAEIVNRITANQAGVVSMERRNWDAKSRLCSSIAKAKRLLDYEPRMDFEKGLTQVHGWFTANWDKIQKSADY